MESAHHKIVNRPATVQPAARLRVVPCKPAASAPPVRLQAATKVSSPHDPEEKEADATAKKIMRMALPRITRTFAGTGRAGVLSRKQKEEKEGKEEKPRLTMRSPYMARFAGLGIFIKRKKEEILQRKAEGQPNVASNVAADIQGNLATGSPLPLSVRRFMEPRFQADFSKVRVHTDDRSARMNRQLSARAFALGDQIFFGRDQFRPESHEGRELIAHELTHTLQQGEVIQPRVEVSKVHTPILQRGAFDWVKDKIKKGLNWAADRLIPGYTLLNVILGKNIITGEPVGRTGVNIIKGYMRLSPIIGSILLSELEETTTLPEAGAWIEAQVAKFGVNFDDLANRLEAMWGEMSVWRGIDYNVEIFKKYLSPVIGPFLAFSGVVTDKVKQLRFEAALRLVGATQLLAAMKKDPAAFKRLVDDPKLILKYFMDALKQGFSHFKDNFGTHFKNALFGWLFGKAAEMGIEMPKEFTAAGLFHLVAQLVGATYQQIRAQVVKKLGPSGESIVSTLEKTVDIVKDLITRGPIALWERVKSFLSDLKEMIFTKISELVTIEIIKAAVLKLVSMLNPVGALVQLVLGIYRVVKFFIDKWETIKQLTNAILDSITNVALGNIAAAAGYIESTMAKGLALVISFLASIFGLSGIVDKVKALIKRISDPVQLAIGKVVGWIVEKGQGLLKKIGGVVLQAGVPQDPNERVRLAAGAAVAAARRLTGGITRALLTPILQGIKLRYGLTVLEPFEQGGDWWVRATINPTTTQKLGPSQATARGEALTAANRAEAIRKLNAITSAAQVSQAMVDLVEDEPQILERYKGSADGYQKYLDGRQGQPFDWPIDYLRRRASLKKGKAIESYWIGKVLGAGKNNTSFQVKTGAAWETVVPDILTGGVVGDCKDWKDISFTAQLRAFHIIAKARSNPGKVKDSSGSEVGWSKSFVVIVRSKSHSEGRTTVSGPLKAAADQIYYRITDKDVK